MLDRIKSVLESARGAYSIVLCTQGELYAFRDPWGVRPLCLGRLGENGYVVASESCALGTVGAQYLREIERGEIVRIDANGLESHRIEVEGAQPALCMFEYIYFARPDSRLNERSVYMARYAMGRELAKEHPVDADVVMAVPDSAVAGGIGYAAESGLPYIEGLIKNRYIGRTFISPDQRMRSRGVHLKFNPLVENLRDQRIIVVDDSIVRGTTTPRIVALLREAGAREVHLRITSPPIKHPCYLGVDMATYDELIAANYTVEQIRERTGADSLGYLSLEGLIASVGRSREEMCLGCLIGEYPNVPRRPPSAEGEGLAPPIRQDRMVQGPASALATVQMRDAWETHRRAAPRFRVVAKRARAPRRGEPSDAFQDRGRSAAQSFNRRRRSDCARARHDGRGAPRHRTRGDAAARRGQ